MQSGDPHLNYQTPSSGYPAYQPPVYPPPPVYQPPPPVYQPPPTAYNQGYNQPLVENPSQEYHHYEPIEQLNARRERRLLIKVLYVVASVVFSIIIYLIILLS